MSTFNVIICIWGIFYELKERGNFPSVYGGKGGGGRSLLYPGQPVETYLEPCISDLCSNGILIDTMGPQTP